MRRSSRACNHIRLRLQQRSRGSDDHPLRDCSLSVEVVLAGWCLPLGLFARSALVTLHCRAPFQNLPQLLYKPPIADDSSNDQMATVHLSPQSVPKKKKNHASTWKWIGIFALLLLAGGAVAVYFAIARAEPIVRARVIETLSNRFHSKVELAGFNVSVVNGIEVSGEGLKIFGATDPNPYEPGV